jgi:beta-lactamase superfamily II metal-dependent hydrolase/GH25 family lysozyme M1 (1,4-beta-N-acetylmuramidase)
MKKIIDVSEHQKRIDWTKVSGVDGVILRVGFGDNDTAQDDKYFLYNITECERLGIPYEVYLYSYADSDKHIQSEINHIKRLLAGRNVRVWFDLEYRPAKAYWRKAVTAFLKAFPSGGVYSWEWVFTDILDGIDCPRWICAYGSNSGEPEYDYKPSIACHGWQYTSRASVPGIAGNVDMSEWYKDFAPAVQRPSAGRESVVARMITLEGYDERNGKHKALIDGYNDYLPTAIKSGTVNYSVKYSDEWCATAASYAYIACGLGYLFPVECSCPRMIALAKKMGIWQENDGYVPDPADAVLYDWEDSGKGDNTGTPDHIGIVIAVDKSKGTFVVMEGNKNESVERRTMSINGKYIRGFITPKFNDPVPEKKDEAKPVAKTYEVSKIGTPNKTTIIKWGLLKNNQKVTPRLQPDESAKPCSFAPVKPLTRIDVYDYITTTKRWAYCKVGGKYGFILASSIADYLRIPKQPIDKVVSWVLADDFGKKETRWNALRTLGYDADAVQGKIDELYGKQPETDTNSPRIRMYAPRFWENNPDYFGDETIFIEGKKGVVFDTGMYGSLAVSKVKALGLDAITIVITHPHGDHTGNVKTMVDKLPVKHVYLPDQTGIRKYQKSYAERMDSIANHCKNAGVPVTWVKMGDSFTVGSLKIQCLFQADADKLKEKDGHHFINNMSMVYKVTAGMWKILIGGDLSAEGILQMMASGVDFSCDAFKFLWHADRHGIKTAFAQALKGVFFAFTQYEHKEGKGNGRTSTYNLLRDIGAFVARAFEDGEINVDFQGTTAKLTTSLGISRTFVKKN